MIASDPPPPSEPQSSPPTTVQPSSTASTENDDLDEFDRRLLHQIEERIDRLEAVKNYAAVKKDRDEAFEMLSDAGELFSIQDSVIKTLNEDNKRLKDRLQELLQVPQNIGDSHSPEQERWRHDAILGRLIGAAMEHPENSARDIPFAYAVSLLKVVRAMCIANNIGTNADIWNASFEQFESTVGLIEIAQSSIASDQDQESDVS